MRIRKLSCAGMLAVTMALSAGPIAIAQDWNAPRGYDNYYHENGTANMAARQGYAAGFSQGQSDFRLHHSFRPTQLQTYPGFAAGDQARRLQAHLPGGLCPRILGGLQGIIHSHSVTYNYKQLSN